MSRQNFNSSTNNSDDDDNRPGPSRERNEDSEEDSDQEPPTDNWELWTKIHSNRDVRLKLLCRDPDDRTPPGSTSIVVRKLPLEATKEQISSLFHKAGVIKSVYFPKIAPHFTTKYCFITLNEFRQAERAIKLFDGYQWGRECLQVVSYDSCYKYRQALIGAKAARETPPEEGLDCATVAILLSDQGSSVVFNAVRQAEAQSESRMTKFVKTTMIQTQIDASNTNRPAVAPSTSGSLPSFFYSDPEDSGNSDNETGLAATTLAAAVSEPAAEIVCGQAALAQEVQADLYLYRECDTIDDMLLDSEVGFLNWLEGRLKFAGPLHYKDQMIGRAVIKTPASVQTMFAWLLGAFRCLSDNRRFQLVGPFLCLPEHSWCAEDKCIALDFRVDDWYKEEWEPMAPNEICSTRCLIRYLSCMLDQFGPIRSDDMRLQQLTLFLPPAAFASWNLTEETSSHGDAGNASARVKGLLDGLERCAQFRLADGLLYSTQSHYEILLLQATMVSNGADGSKKRQVMVQ